MLKQLDKRTIAHDHAALVAACDAGVGLCTVTEIDGSFSRRTGAQLAVLPDGSTIGSLADGCLEAQLAADCLKLNAKTVCRYGQGSPLIDFRLPCGGGLDITIDPYPDRHSLRKAVKRLDDRRPAEVAITRDYIRRYVPHLRVLAYGEGPELDMVEKLSATMGIEISARRKRDLSLGRADGNMKLDGWTACLFLFHDHEWELVLLEQALATDAFYIGAQGGERARTERVLALAARGLSEERIARIRSPIGLIGSCKSPETLALSAIAEIVGEYEAINAASY